MIQCYGVLGDEGEGVNQGQSEGAGEGERRLDCVLVVKVLILVCKCGNFSLKLKFPHWHNETKFHACCKTSPRAWGWVVGRLGVILEGFG